MIMRAIRPKAHGRCELIEYHPMAFLLFLQGDRVQGCEQNREATFDIELQAGDRVTIFIRQDDGSVRSNALRRATINGYNATDLFVWNGSVFATQPVGGDGKMQLRVAV